MAVEGADEIGVGLGEETVWELVGVDLDGGHRRDVGLVILTL